MCGECGEEKPHLALGLCHRCYRRQNRRRPKLVTCADCGEMKPHVTRGLCRHCYQQARVGECVLCGSFKQIASHGRCWGCYNHVRDPERAARVAARDAARAERQRAEAADIECRKQIRCVTCSRLLYLVKRRVPPHGSKYCDAFCKNHSPKYRGTRCLYPDELHHKKPREEMARRQAEAAVQIPIAPRQLPV